VTSSGAAWVERSCHQSVLAQADGSPRPLRIALADIGAHAWPGPGVASCMSTLALTGRAQTHPRSLARCSNRPSIHLTCQLPIAARSAKFLFRRRGGCSGIRGKLIGRYRARPLRCIERSADGSQAGPWPGLSEAEAIQALYRAAHSASHAPHTASAPVPRQHQPLWLEGRILAGTGR